MGLLAAAVDSYDDAHAPRAVAVPVRLAEAHVYDGNVDAAVDVAARCLTLSAGVTSARGTERVHVLRGLRAPHHGTAAVDAFEEQAAAVLGPS